MNHIYIIRRAINTIKSLFFINRFKSDTYSSLEKINIRINQLESDRTSKLNITPLLSENITKENFDEFIINVNSNFQSIEYSIANVLHRLESLNPQTTGFNSQNNRKKIFKELTDAVNFESIIETGTFLGDTTYWMSLNSNLPVYTTEANSVFYGISKARLFYNQKIILYNLDSREFLKILSDTTDVYDKKVFIYLDSHWYKDLPLRDEMSFICDNSKDFVVMIDDFKVPGDEGYEYDDYGDDNILEIEYLKDILEKYNISVYFPSLHSSEETGAKRGCVVLTNLSNSDTIINRNVSSLYCFKTIN